MTDFDKFVMWNCAGLRATTASTDEKFAFFDSQCPNGNFSVAAIIETHHKDAADFSQDLGRYKQTHHLFHSPVENETHSGVIVLISKSFEIFQQSEPLPGRLMNFQMKKSDEILNLSVFYGPQWGKLKKEDVRTVLDKFSTLHEADHTNLIMGDFNFVDLDVDKGKNMDARDRMIKPIWDNILCKHILVDPFRAQCPRKRIFSFTSAQGKSRGDRLYISEDKIASVTNIRYTTTPFKTAHKLFTFNIRNGPKIGPSTWKMNSSILEDENYTSEIEEIFEGLQAMDIENPLDWWDLFISVVSGTTISYTKAKAKTRNSLKQYYHSQVDFYEAKESLTAHETHKYNHYKNCINEILMEEIRGHEIRTKGQPKYEINEPDISMYSKFEKRYQAKSVIYELSDDTGQVKTGTNKLLDITEKFYTKLFKKSTINTAKQNKLLKKISKKLSLNDRHSLDRLLTLEELEKAVMSLANGKSPGPDGITSEFYKKFWYLIKDKFLDYINTAKKLGFRDLRNRSSTTLIYKHKGELYKLDNYRPIALINIDIKILTKVLSNRLRPVLPSIIHHSQTAVDARRIDNTVHLLRDLVDLINKDDEGALIFLDQEKAFDRVEHEFLFATMKAFGIGNSFIDWLKVLYSNATTTIKVNGFHTNPIPLTRGLRQGCPLSPSLYVLIIEIFALQLRTNTNIVGFKIGGERIVSLHYADDTTIVIKQNCCFKEVFKEIQEYEMASGAKVNYRKTKGLWLGRWKNRTDKPLGISWTCENVRNLGIYVGNEDPIRRTFEEILPKIKKSMNYWKQFQLSKFSKVRVLEIFHASRLWYASTFYPVPLEMKKELQTEFKNYVNFPRA